MASSESPGHESQREVWEKLFFKVLDGESAETDLLSLSELVCRDETACREYFDEVAVESLLVSAFAPEFSGTKDPLEIHPSLGTRHGTGGQPYSNAKERRTDVGGKKRPLAVVAIAGVALLALGGMAFWQGGFGGGAVEPGQPFVASAASRLPSAHGVGVLAEQAGAVWQEGAVRTGSILPRGRLALEAGTAHLDLFSGVQLVVEGKTAFTIESPLRVVLHQGAVRALVPDAAHGFEVVTAAAAIVDLGTEFALRVDGDTTDVTVLQGEIEVVKQQREIARVDSGRSIRLRGNSTDLEELASRVNLPSSAAVAEAAQERRQQNFIRWQSSLEKLVADQRLIGRYAIVHPDCGRIVPNVAGQAPSGSDAAVVGAECSRDRWGRQSSAIDYTRSGSRLRLALPGQLEGLTLVCWVKINSLSNDYNALLLTDGHDVSEPHWQVLRDGRIFFSVKHSQEGSIGGSQKVFYSPSFWREEMSGRWIMLAVTYDRSQRLVKHFVNGILIGNEAIPEWAMTSHVQIGDASIANWAEPVYRTDEQFTSRNLNGVIDEFLIFSEPLAGEEILSLYESGNVE